MNKLTRFITLLFTIILLIQNINVPIARGEAEQIIPWSFHVYAAPDFRAETKSFHAPQAVNVIESKDDGWALISTYNGNGWVYLRENMRFVNRGVNLHENIRGNTVGRIEPQMVTILAQEGDWLQISTWLGPRWIYFRQVQPDGRRATITFDDGPSPYTERLLDALHVRNVTATFYVTGQNVARYPELAKRIVAEGHEIASHTYTHPNLTTLTADEIRDELNRTNSIINETTGATVTSMRIPYASYNSTVQSVARELGMPIIMWTVDTRDWETGNVDAIMGHFANRNGLRIRDRDIILFHDTFDAAIDGAIRGIDLLLEEGFTLVTASELLAESHGTLTPGDVYRR